MKSDLDQLIDYHQTQKIAFVQLVKNCIGDQWFKVNFKMYFERLNLIFDLDHLSNLEILVCLQKDNTSAAVFYDYRMNRLTGLGFRLTDGKNWVFNNFNIDNIVDAIAVKILISEIIYNCFQYNEFDAAFIKIKP